MATTYSPGFVEVRTQTSRFTQFAWLILGWNLIVVLWGAFVRATGSGAGCGSHWPLCNGDVIPRAPGAQTIIEFTHRLTSGVALLGVVALLVWALRTFPPRHTVRRYSAIALGLIFVEALLGAGLVLLRYVESNASIGRAIYLSAHLVNTQLLLGALALVAWFSRPEMSGQRFRFGPIQTTGLLPLVLIVGVSGAIAALGDTLYPARSVAEGIQQELSETAHFLIRLRIFHPAIAILSAVGVAFGSLWVIRRRISDVATRLAWYSFGTVALQLALGGLDVLLLAPVAMQLVHLLVANFLWLLLVLLVVATAPASSPRTAS